MYSPTYGILGKAHFHIRW